MGLLKSNLNGPNIIEYCQIHDGELWSFPNGEVIYIKLSHGSAKLTGDEVGKYYKGFEPNMEVIAREGILTIQERMFINPQNKIKL